MVKLVIKECDGLCSSKCLSYFRKTGKEDLMNFSFDEYERNMEERAPLLHAVLQAASMGKSKMSDEQYLPPSVCMAASVCSKNRSPYMKGLQLLNRIITQHSGLMVCLKL